MFDQFILLLRVILSNRTASAHLHYFGENTGTDIKYGVTNYGIARLQVDFLTECIAIRLISESLVACLDRLFNRVSSHGATVVLCSVVGTPSPVGAGWLTGREQSTSTTIELQNSSGMVTSSR